MVGVPDNAAGSTGLTSVDLITVDLISVGLIRINSPAAATFQPTKTKEIHSVLFPFNGQVHASL